MEEWRHTEFGQAHLGRVGVVLADGTEPGPVYLDAGSGTNFQTRTDWWLYDGAAWSRAPRADAVRAACACGWRGTATYPLVWIAPDDAGTDRERPTADVAACHDDWAAHIADVDAATVPVPDEVASLLADLKARLTTLADEAPLAALRVLGQVERITRDIGEIAACCADGDHEETDIARALGVAETDVRGRLLRYTLG